MNTPVDRFDEDAEMQKLLWDLAMRFIHGEAQYPPNKMVDQFYLCCLNLLRNALSPEQVIDYLAIKQRLVRAKFIAEGELPQKRPN